MGNLQDKKIVIERKDDDSYVLTGVEEGTNVAKSIVFPDYARMLEYLIINVMDVTSDFMKYMDWIDKEDAEKYVLESEPYNWLQDRDED